MCASGLRALFALLLVLGGLSATTCYQAPKLPSNAPSPPSSNANPHHPHLEVPLSRSMESVPSGMSSLTFVFDRTGSMGEDLNQGIFETVMNQRKKFIYNYVLVLFHDPDVDEAFVTTDSDLFQAQLNSVNVQGGGDYPEMTLTGIQRALEVSLPGSYIYVFTDAPSKDYHLEERVLNLIQEKQSSVVFVNVQGGGDCPVMTGDCGNQSDPGYKVFERIAAASFGQVFHLEKSAVNTVLAYVRHSVAQRRVHILFEERELGQTHTSLVPVDAYFSELTISLSGERGDDDSLSVTLIDPQNRTIEKSAYEESGAIDLKSVKLIRIKEPQAGVWRVRVTSRLRHTLRIFGHGVIDFRYGFAPRIEAEIDGTNPRPVAGEPTYLLVNTGLRPPGMVVLVGLVYLLWYLIDRYLSGDSRHGSQGPRQPSPPPAYEELDTCYNRHCNGMTESLVAHSTTPVLIHYRCSACNQKALVTYDFITDGMRCRGGRFTKVDSASDIHLTRH